MFLDTRSKIIPLDEIRERLQDHAARWVSGHFDPLLAEHVERLRQARAQGRKVKIGRFPFAGDSRATILGHHEGFIKVVADEQYGEILGVHIIGPEAFELIAEAVTAMEAEATVDVMMQTIHAHPTLYAAMGEAFNAVYGLSINA